MSELLAFLSEENRRDHTLVSLEKIREGVDEAREHGVKRVGCVAAPTGTENAIGPNGSNKGSGERGLYIGLRRGNFV